jgi:hypothetical protein
MYAGGLWYEPPVKIKDAKKTPEVFDKDSLLETVYRIDFLYPGAEYF